MKTIAIIDIIGIPYDGTTVYNEGLGGSESAVTFISKELARLGFSVTVFNNCDMDHASPGVYDDVTYRPLSELAQGKMGRIPTKLLCLAKRSSVCGRKRAIK